jgi:hypothetical protein
VRPSFGCQDAGFRINEAAPAITAKTASMIRPPATASTKWWGAKAASLRSGEPRATCSRQDSIADALATPATVPRMRVRLSRLSAEMAARGFLNERGAPFNHKSVASMLAA